VPGSSSSSSRIVCVYVCVLLCNAMQCNAAWHTRAAHCVANGDSNFRTVPVPAYFSWRVSSNIFVVLYLGVCSLGSFHFFYAHYVLHTCAPRASAVATLHLTNTNTCSIIHSIDHGRVPCTSRSACQQLTQTTADN